MKPATPLRGLLPNLFSVFAPLSLSVALPLGMLGQASAEAVDSELVLLVDVSQSGLNNKSFDALMISYASTFTSSEVISAIQSGTYGRIAVSMMFYGETSVQQVAIPWMSIGNNTDAALFASLITGIGRPPSSSVSDVASALTAAVPSFGSETGGASNGFESTVQIIDFAASTEPRSAAAVQTASNAAFTAGVDVINAIALGNKANSIAAYFDANVIGTSLPGPVLAATPLAANNPTSAALTAALTQHLNGSIGAGVSAVPEPGTAACLVSSLGFLLLLRRRI